LEVFREVNPQLSAQSLDELVEGVMDALASSTAGEPGSASFWGAELRRPVSLAFFVAFFNQASGINAVLYFAPRIFGLAGLGDSAALLQVWHACTEIPHTKCAVMCTECCMYCTGLQSVGIGLVNLAAVLLGLWCASYPTVMCSVSLSVLCSVFAVHLSFSRIRCRRLIDRWGRRTLLLYGSVGYVLSLGLTSLAFHWEVLWLVAPGLFAFVFAHSVGQGTVVWVRASPLPCHDCPLPSRAELIKVAVVARYARC
jgi:SP family arabinose:H+ symporter-like MFS transporter